MVVLQHGPAHGTESALRTQVEGLVGQVVEGERPVVREFFDFGPPHVSLVSLEFYELDSKERGNGAALRVRGGGSCYKKNILGRG